eukprot:PhF_6_TR21938/c0_g1_i1/m.31177
MFRRSLSYSMSFIEALAAAQMIAYKDKPSSFNHPIKIPEPIQTKMRKSKHVTQILEPSSSSTSSPQETLTVQRPAIVKYKTLALNLPPAIDRATEDTKTNNNNSTNKWINKKTEIEETYNNLMANPFIYLHMYYPIKPGVYYARNYTKCLTDWKRTDNTTYNDILKGCKKNTVARKNIMLQRWKVMHIRSARSAYLMSRNKCIFHPPKTELHRWAMLTLGEKKKWQARALVIHNEAKAFLKMTVETDLKKSRQSLETK